MTPDEVEVAEEEAKVYVSGQVSFIKDNPGRQAIGKRPPQAQKIICLQIFVSFARLL